MRCTHVYFPDVHAEPFGSTLKLLAWTKGPKLARTILFIAAGLFIFRVLFRSEFRKLGKRVDEFVNMLLLAFFLSYALQALWIWLK